MERASSEAFADFTLSRVPHKVRASLTDEQYEAIRNALIASEGSSRHSLDVRVRVPLFFRAYYFVLFGGRDRRKKTFMMEMNRINRLPKPLRRTFYLGATFLILFSIFSTVFVSAYFLKTWAGIDLFPGLHLHDILPLDIFLPPDQATTQ